jgi:hypothetical protein
MKSVLKIVRRPVVLFAACLFFVGVTTGVIYAASVTKDAGGAISRFDAVEVGAEQPIGGVDEVCTTSTEYEDMPGMTKTFQQGGLLSANPIVVMFNIQVQSFGRSYVRLVVDGVPQTGIASEMELGENGDIGVDSWNFISDPVTQGTHTAKLQWRKDPSVGQMCMFNRSMIVLHR